MFSVIFDMDGTLLDTQRISLDAWDYAGKLFGYENMSSHVPNVCGVTEEYCTNYLREHFPNLDIPAFRKAAIQYEHDNLVVKYKSGAEELLKFLKQNNVKMAVASGSSPQIIKERMGAIGAEVWFDVILSGSEVENGKPEPDVFLEAAKRIGAAPENCFVFEDSVNGIVAAHKAGMRPIGIPDIVQFKDETKKLMFAEFDTMDKAIEILKEYL